MSRWSLRIASIAVLALVAAGCDWTTFGFVASGGRYNSAESTIGVANVASLTPAWTATSSHVSSSPTVAGGVVYVTGDSDELEAYDANGVTGCSGSPATCAPLWTATTGSATGSTPAVDNGVVFVGAADGRLYAFDDSGSTGCSGAPKTCSSLWTASTGGSISSSPVVANGVVYIGSRDDRLYAFDVSGATGCSGSPKTCAPLWTAPTDGSVTSSPAVANGVVYIGSDSPDGLFAFDASGATGCSGSPKTCTPLWRGDAELVVNSSPAVVNGVVYIGTEERGALLAFDAAGSAGCGGSPKVCEPLWTGTTGLHVLASPAVANGKVYIANKGTDGGGTNVFAFDASGTTNCAGTPKSCTPLWTTGETNFLVESSPAVANGVVYNTSFDGNVYAYDADTGAALWNAPVGNGDSPTVANGSLYVSSSSSLTAFKP
jgi:outer membrane protein assembly factor BamB